MTAEFAGSLGFASLGGKMSLILDSVVTETSLAPGGTKSGVEFSSSKIPFVSYNDRL